MSGPLGPLTALFWYNYYFCKAFMLFVEITHNTFRIPQKAFGIIDKAY